MTKSSGLNRGSDIALVELAPSPFVAPVLCAGDRTFLKKILTPITSTAGATMPERYILDLFTYGSKSDEKTFAMVFPKVSSICT